MYDSLLDIDMEIKIDSVCTSRNRVFFSVSVPNQLYIFNFIYFLKEFLFSTSNYHIIVVRVLGLTDRWMHHFVQVDLP